MDLQHWVEATWVEVEGPAACIVRWSAKANRQNLFQAEQSSHNDRAVGPRTGPRDDQAVAAWFDGIAVAAVSGDAAADVVGVAIEFAGRGDIAHGLLVLFKGLPDLESCGIDVAVGLDEGAGQGFDLQSVSHLRRQRASSTDWVLMPINTSHVFT